MLIRLGRQAAPLPRAEDIAQETPKSGLRRDEIGGLEEGAPVAASLVTLDPDGDRHLIARLAGNSFRLECVAIESVFDPMAHCHDVCTRFLDFDYQIDRHSGVRGRSRMGLDVGNIGTQLVQDGTHGISPPPNLVLCRPM